MISDTKGYINTSVYKQHLKKAVESLNLIHEDTIRIGYVIFFHKYESFINEYVSWMENNQLDLTKNAGQTLIEYCKEKFDFNPRAWWKFPSVHTVNFISNCSKHHDGKCKVKDSKHTKRN